MSMPSITDEQAVRDTIQAWALASTAGDYMALEPLMHPGVIFLTPGGAPMNFDAFREQFLNVVKTLSIECVADTREVEVADDLAYAWNWLSVRLKDVSADVAASREGYSLSVYKRSAAGRWQLWRDANLMLRPTS